MGKCQCTLLFLKTIKEVLPGYLEGRPAEEIAGMILNDFIIRFLVDGRQKKGVSARARASVCEDSFYCEIVYGDKGKETITGDIEQLWEELLKKRHFSHFLKEAERKVRTNLMTGFY